ncbi:nickel pincer cofactor biosynthesis protein LarB [Halovenus sp. WSH3]|uniref:Nickel pincer cofactor biosynthesis protein LarB n=1 Tax=Halovenus carboxidivorans TaxID=2692199 RepID=A0A6B0T484_9EURY|nr:nickel pincer cofactor biosynthesis protein LarB [Halovenus carboxidivorans]MXR50986.1 nickel pincer cofactor biosynthesis protein LarB [Halovenus carboxidivorans]
MRELLEAVADGDLSPAAAESELRGYVTSDAGRFDTARAKRAGVPEVILAAGKTTEEIQMLVETSLAGTGRAIVTRATATTTAALEEQYASDPEMTITVDERAQTVVVHESEFDRPDLDATVGVVTAGTSDAMPAGEAATILREMGATVERVEDIGVASLDRMLDQVPRLREQDVLIVAAGREGALPTVLAGLVDVPIIGLPISTGYGHGGEGEAALSGLLQSCTALSVVNIDAGFTAGVQAGLIARQLDGARE